MVPAPTSVLPSFSTKLKRWSPRVIRNFEREDDDDADGGGAGQQGRSLPTSRKLLNPTRNLRRVMMMRKRASIHRVFRQALLGQIVERSLHHSLRHGRVASAALFWLSFRRLIILYE